MSHAINRYAADSSVTALYDQVAADQHMLRLHDAYMARLAQPTHLGPLALHHSHTLRHENDDTVDHATEHIEQPRGKHVCG